MARLLRQTWNALAALSLLLLAGAAVLWVRSYRTADTCEFQWRGVRWQLASERGRLRLDDEPQRRIERERWLQQLSYDAREYLRLGIEEGTVSKLDFWQDRRVPWETRGVTALEESQAESWATAERRRLRAKRDEALARMRADEIGLGLTVQRPPRRYSAYYATLAAAFAAWPLVRLVQFAVSHRRRRRRRLNHLCRRCGYDLTGNESGTCPECGAAVPVPPRGRR